MTATEPATPHGRRHPAWDGREAGHALSPIGPGANATGKELRDAPRVVNLGFGLVFGQPPNMRPTIMAFASTPRESQLAALESPVFCPKPTPVNRAHA